MTAETSTELTQLRDYASLILNGLTYTSRLRDDGLQKALTAFDAARACGDDASAALAGAAGALRVQVAQATTGLVDIEYTDFIDSWQTGAQRFRPWHRAVSSAFILVVVVWTIMTGYCTLVFDQVTGIATKLTKIDSIAFAESKARLYGQAQRFGFVPGDVAGLTAAPPAAGSPSAAKPATEGGDSKSASLVLVIHDIAALTKQYLDIEGVVRDAATMNKRLDGILVFFSFDFRSASVGLSDGAAPATTPTSKMIQTCTPRFVADPDCPTSGSYSEPSRSEPPDNPSIRAMDQFLRSVNVSINPAVLDLVPSYEDKLRFPSRALGAWLLPALYGALGAAIYYLRRLLRTSLPNPPFARVATRVVLGGLAGVLVASMWTAPVGTGQNLMTLSPFLVAFLFGYSIEIFFRLLDKLVFSVQKQIDSIDAPPVGK